MSSNGNGDLKGRIGDGFPAQEAQASRQQLMEMLNGIKQAKAEINQRLILEGKQPQPQGLPIRDLDAPMLIATHAVCCHLHHLTTVLVGIKQELGLPPSLAESAEPRTMESDLEEDR